MTILLFLHLQLDDFRVDMHEHILWHSYRGRGGRFPLWIFVLV